MPADPSAAPPHDDVRFVRRVVFTVGVTLLGLALALLLWYGVRVLLVGFAGVLLAVLLRAIAAGVTRLTRLPAGWALGVTLVGIAGLFVGAWLLLAPDVAEQANQLADRLPPAFERLRQQVEGTPWGRQLFRLLDRFTGATGGSGGGGGGGGVAAPTTQIVRRATDLLSSTLGVVLDLLIILFLGIYLAAQPGLYVDGLASLFPPARRARVCQVLHELGETLRWWLIAQGVDMLVIGALTWAGLWAMGIPLALTLGLLAALFNFIPNFGPLFSYVPAVLLALVDGPEKAGYVTIFYVVLQNIEGYLLLPLLQRNAVDTPPALLIGAQVLLTLLVGGLGLALAAPLSACALVVVKMLYLHDVLGDPVRLATRAEPARRDGSAL
jgi:predicted PurR-regulated permease PerM